MAPRLRCVLLLAGVILAPGCGSSTPTVPSVTRAALTLTVDPNPVVATLNTLTGAVSAPYKITITETGGLGGELVFVTSSVYDPATGKQVGLTYYDSADLVVYVGSKRVEPNGTLVVPQAASYTLPNLSKAANLTVSVQLKDDRQNLVNVSLLVKIE
jgi:hypothetical protein